MKSENPPAVDQRRSPFRFSLLWRTLRYRNYRLFFAGQLVSLIGTWMTNTATVWLVYRLSGSALMLGLVGFSSQIPAAVLSPLAGIYIDQWNKHRVLVATQVLSMLQSFALAALALSGKITVGWLIGLNALQGVINAFEMPCRQSFVISLVEEKENLGNAIALNSSMFNAARLLGPSIAGIVIAWIGEGWCFFADGVSFLAVLASLLAMRLAPRPAGQRSTTALAEFREGWRYTFGSPPLRAIITLLALTSLVGVPYTVLVPIFAGKLLGGGPHTLGFLMAAAGAGALLAALWLAARRSVLGLTRVVPWATATFGGGLILFSLSRWLPLSLLLMMVAGFGFMTQMAASNTVLQTIVEDDKRGRVMSLFVFAFLGTAPLGSLLAGGLADRLGAPWTLRLGGLGCVLGSLWFFRQLPQLRLAIRPIYLKLGILREVAEGIERVSVLEKLE
ncbi:MAG TPA: MFS transporter [Elusimicrobiota bacterium]|nr:MFS transporter [Elusimicrobiota bacterium]